MHGYSIVDHQFLKFVTGSVKIDHVNANYTELYFFLHFFLCGHLYYMCVCMCMCVYVCPPLRLLITSGVM